MPACIRAEPLASNVAVAFSGLKNPPPRRGGRARAEAVSRSMRARFALWDSGDYTALWDLVATQKPPKVRRGDKPPGFKHIAHLVDSGLLSKAAGRLTSRGVAPDSPEVFEQVKALFPPAPARPQSAGRSLKQVT